MKKRFRLAVVATHPIQYQAPLWRKIAEDSEIDVHVFYVTRYHLESHHDPSFGKSFAWDIPLLGGYSHEFLESRQLPFVSGPPSAASGPVGARYGVGIAAKLVAGAFDAVLVHGYASGAAWSGTIGGLRSGVPVILRGESHDRGRPDTIAQRARRIALRWWLKRIAVVIAIGELNREFWRRLSVPEARLRKSIYAVDNEFFATALRAFPQRREELRRSWCVNEGDTVFLFCGKLVTIKGPDLLLEAFAALKASGAHLVFVGSGPLENDLRRAQVGRNIRNVHWAGFRNQSELPHYYAAADALVLPSRVEPWGLVVNESMACGTPCIVSWSVGAGPDLVEGKGTGLVFETNKGVRLGDCLLEALSPDKRQAWRAAIPAVLHRASYDDNIATLTEALEWLRDRDSHGETRA